MQLKIARKIAGLTQRQLAHRAHVDPTIISGLERGTRRSASYITLVRLARALNCEPEELFPVALTDAEDSLLDDDEAHHERSETPARRR
ncbi:MAG TPA: helix-turn-helix transcriptional regulator [Burkholderiales bacterium]|nr:helix-turn-helix transcriptional regulator [Burkholderiales bacterium]